MPPPYGHSSCHDGAGAQLTLPAAGVAQAYILLATESIEVLVRVELDAGRCRGEGGKEGKEGGEGKHLGESKSGERGRQEANRTRGVKKDMRESEGEEGCSCTSERRSGVRCDGG